MIAKITLTRNQIQFENCGLSEEAEGGNGQDCTRHAAMLWDDAATRFITDAGHEADVQVRYQHDHHAVGIYVTSLDTDEDGDELELTSEEEASLEKIARDADEAGWNAVGEWVEWENKDAERLSAELAAEEAEAAQ